MKYIEAKELALNYDAKLLATDPRFRRTVEIGHEDGSYFKWCNAFLMENEEWIFVFTEHFGFHLFDSDDLKSFICYTLNGKKVVEADIEQML